MGSCKKFWKVLALALILSAQASAAEFEIFDGRSYNGKFYPRVDIIEWTEKSHQQSSMEFQVYWKGHAVDMSYALEEKDGRKVMLVNYFIKERNERLCRRVLAPGHFTQSFRVYKDTSDKDMDNTIVTMEEIQPKSGLAAITPSKYVGCEDVEAEKERRSIAVQSEGQEHQFAPPAVDSHKAKKPSAGGGFKKKGVDVPFGDL